MAVDDCVGICVELVTDSVELEASLDTSVDVASDVVVSGVIVVSLEVTFVVSRLDILEDEVVLSTFVEVDNP